MGEVWSCIGLIVLRNGNRECVIVWRVRVCYLLNELGPYNYLAHGADHSLVRFSWLEKQEVVVFWRQVESSPVEHAVNLSVGVGRVPRVVLELSMQLRDNENIAIEPVSLNLKHYVALSSSYKSLVGLDQVFAEPLVGGIWNISVPGCVFLHQDVPLVVDDDLIWCVGTGVHISWANEFKKDWVSDCFCTCAKLALLLLLAVARLQWGGHTRVAAGWLGKVVVV